MFSWVEKRGGTRRGAREIFCHQNHPLRTILDPCMCIYIYIYICMSVCKADLGFHLLHNMFFNVHLLVSRGIEFPTGHIFCFSPFGRKTNTRGRWKTKRGLKAQRPQGKERYEPKSDQAKWGIERARRGQVTRSLLKLTS